jgi:hypothetical protein
MFGRLSILTLIVTSFAAVAANAQTSIALPSDRAFPENIAASHDARVGRTAWVSEGQLSDLFDPAMKDQKPSLPFQISSVTLPGAH